MTTQVPTRIDAVTGFSNLALVSRVGVSPSGSSEAVAGSEAEAFYAIAGLPLLLDDTCVRVLLPEEAGVIVRDLRLEACRTRGEDEGPISQRPVLELLERTLQEIDSPGGGEVPVAPWEPRPVAATVAQWRPFHEARLTRSDGNADTVQLMTHAAVWQKTGEDWLGVELALSTARPSLGLDMPVPSADRLTVRNKTEEERKQ